MTLEDAIKHLEEVIPEMECSPCKDEHIQLLGWLKELKNLKEVRNERLCTNCIE